MKKIYTSALLLFCLFGFGQQSEFTFSQEGLTDYVVTECDGTQTELYNKALDWINLTYKNPGEVLKATKENDYIRIEGSSNDIICMNTLGTITKSPARYHIEISFKDGKYKFDVLSVERFVQGRWSAFDLKDVDVYYNKKGELRGVYKCMADAIPAYFNTLNSSLKNHIQNGAATSKSNDW